MKTAGRPASSTGISSVEWSASGGAITVWALRLAISDNSVSCIGTTAIDVCHVSAACAMTGIIQPMLSPKPVPPERWRLSVAPMLDWTDRHCRYFHRLLTQHALLYTEMITTGAILQGDRDKLLFFNPEENPLALQLGGSEPKALAACAKIGEDYGYDEINLNV